jgi:hypothetical protein
VSKGCVYDVTSPSKQKPFTVKTCCSRLLAPDVTPSCSGHDELVTNPSDLMPPDSEDLSVAFLLKLISTGGDGGGVATLFPTCEKEDAQYQDSCNTIIPNLYQYLYY